MKLGWPFRTNPDYDKSNTNATAFWGCVMIIVIGIIAILCLASSADAARTPTPTPTPKGVVEKQGMVCRTKQQDLELRDWINGLINEVHKAQTETKNANDSNFTTLNELHLSVAAATALANECAADKACAKAPLSCWFHRLLKHIFILAAVLIVILIAVTIFAPGAMKLIISFFSFIWSWIVALFSPKPKV